MRVKRAGFVPVCAARREGARSAQADFSAVDSVSDFSRGSVRANRLR